MADLTQDAPIRILGEAKTERFTIDTAAARTFYKGQPAMVDQDVDATGNVVQFVDAVAVAITDVFVGIAAEGKSVLIGASESTEIECYVEPTIVGFKSTAFSANDDLGKSVLMSDSGTLSETTLENVRIGKVTAVRDGYVYVQLESPYICTGAGA